MDREFDGLILRLVRENHRWGYGKIEGELLKLGYAASRTAIRNVLKRLRGGMVDGAEQRWHRLSKRTHCENPFYQVRWIRSYFCPSVTRILAKSSPWVVGESDIWVKISQKTDT